MVILEAFLLIMISVIAPLLWVMYFGDMSIMKHDKRMEDLNIKHARDMQELHRISGNLFQDENRFIITYLVPTPYQPKWVRLFNRIRIYPYDFQYSTGKKNKGPPSRYTKTISKSKWFYMQLKNWAETENRDAAIDAMKYLRWKRDIP